MVVLDLGAFLFNFSGLLLVSLVFFILRFFICGPIFPNADDAILHYLKDDGQSIEPIYYVPIIPMIFL